MFTLPIEKARTKTAAGSNNQLAHQRSTPVPKRASNLTANASGEYHEQETDRMRMSDQDAVPSLPWNFTEIPVFPLDRTNQLLERGPRSLPLLSVKLPTLARDRNPL